MVNREWQTVKKLTYSSTPDQYGQLRTGTPTESNVEMVVKIYSQTNNDNPKYVDIDLVGLTKDTSITTSNQILIGTEKYSVKYVIPSRRLYSVLMRKV